MKNEKKNKSVSVDMRHKSRQTLNGIAKKRQKGYHYQHS